MELGRLVRLTLFFTFIFIAAAKLGNPYNILGVSREAKTPEIRKAYKQLAKEWHPDKNSAPDAQNRFLQISEAYKLLSDAERRRLYDTTGKTEEPARHPNQYRQDQFNSFDPFEDILNNFGSRGFNFKFFREGGDGMNIYKKQSITMTSYESIVMPKSKKMPYLLLLYSDLCVACGHIEPIWRRLVEELEPINFGMATVHAGKETELARKLGVKTVPYLILLLDGHPVHYTEPSISMASSLDFIKSKFPHKLVHRITEENLHAFLYGWTDNKIRVLIFGRLDIIRLRYLTVGWEFRDRAVVGYIQLDKVDTDSIRAKYGVSSKVDTLLVFHEDPMTPVASVAMTDLPYATMKDIIEANKFLVLPRLSSQPVFDALCPVEHMWSRRRLCVVLVTQDISDHDGSRASLRDYAVGDKGGRDRVRYAYIFKDKQADFINALSSVSLSQTDLHIVILWRKDHSHLKFEWLQEMWIDKADKHNNSKEALRTTVHRLLHSNDPMPFETEVQELFDEHAQGIIWRIINRIYNMMDYFRAQVTHDDIVPAISVLASILFIVAGGYVMSYLVKLEEDTINEKRYKEGKGSLDQEMKSTIPKVQLSIHELRGETYNGLIRLIKPGCRTVVLLCDTETKSKLMPKFHKACWPYRKNKTLMFAFLNVERTVGMEWYKRILSLGLPEPRELNINPKNTIGTVISLNGHRKYYCIFHAKHPEDLRLVGVYPGTQDSSGVRRRNARSSLTGGFMGFSESDSGSESDIEVGDRKKDSVASDRPLLNYYSHVLFEDQLLEGLSNWLDRLFEGSTHRYYINYWPDWPGK